jgi:hypothetical protein
MGNKSGTKLYTVESELSEEILNYTMFQPSKDAVTDGVLVNEVMSAGRIYLIRKPLSAEVGSDIVKKNWLKGIFTSDEADYLNSLNIRPDMLKSIFGNNWLIELASFMDNMITSNCFTDVSITTKAKCDVAANFIEKIFEYFILHDERIATLQDEDDIFAKQAAANMISKAKGDMDFIEEGVKEKMAKLISEKEELEAREVHMGKSAILTPDLNKNPFTDGVLKNSRRMAGVWNKQVSRNINDVISGDSNWLRSVLLISSKDHTASIGDLYVNAIDEIDANTKINEQIKLLNSEYPMWVFK